MVHKWTNGSQLGKMSHIREKWVTFRKMGHTNKNGSALVKWVTLGKMG